MLAIIMAIEDEKDRYKAERLYLAYRNIMFYAAKRILKDDARSEDALQNAFEGIIKNLNAIHEVDSIRTKSYVIRVAKNSAISLYRKDRRFVSFDEEFAISEIELSQSMDVEDDVKYLMEEIYQISPIYRDVLILKSLHGYSKLVDSKRGELELYKNKNGDFISFKYGELPQAALWADIRNMTIDKNKIYGLWQKEQMIGEMKQLIWKNGNYIFCLTTNTARENLYDLAESTNRVRTKYIPTYIPKGFKKTYMDDIFESSFIYEKGELYISIDYEDIDAGKPSYDNEHTVIEKGTFQGYPSYFVYKKDKKDKTNGLMWYDDEYFFDVTTNISKYETYKIAKGLKKISQ